MDISSLLGMNYVDYVYLPVAGTCGGIIVVARGPDIHLSDVNVGHYSVTISVHPGDDGRTPW
jgi:hypothetical protein